MRRKRDAEMAVSQQGHYAGGVTRLAAYALDFTAMSAVFTGAAAVLAWAVNFVTDGELTVPSVPWLVATAYAIWAFLYFSYPWATSGKTLGMAVLGIRVVARDGSPVTPRQAVVRFFGLQLSFLTLGLGFVGIIIGREHRALQDVLAGTAVVYSWDARGARLRFLARDARASA